MLIAISSELRRNRPHITGLLPQLMGWLAAIVFAVLAVLALATFLPLDEFSVAKLQALLILGIPGLLLGGSLAWGAWRFERTSGWLVGTTGLFISGLLMIVVALWPRQDPVTEGLFGTVFILALGVARLLWATGDFAARPQN